MGNTSKICSVCKLNKPISRYVIRKDTGKIRNRCNECAYKKTQECRIKREYGLSDNAYKVLIGSREKTCEICGASGDKVKICIDHCHNTGAVRGVLCNRCNIAIGAFQDNADLLRKAADYVERFERDFGNP